MEIKRYWIVEEGEYSDYSLYFVEDDPRLTKEELETVLRSSSRWSTGVIAGLIEGYFVENTNIRVQKTKDFKDLVEEFAHGLTCCYQNRRHTTNLDRKYTEKELYEIACANDGSGAAFWEVEIKTIYPKYLALFDIYQKIK